MLSASIDYMRRAGHWRTIMLAEATSTAFGRRPGKLAWTRRLRTLAAVSGVISLVLLTLSWPTAVIAVVLTPVVVDLALVITGPVAGEAYHVKRVLQQVERYIATWPRVEFIDTDLTLHYPDE